MMAWSRENPVEEEAAPEEERLDPDAARRLFPATQGSQPRRVVAWAPDGTRQPRAAPPKPRAQVRPQCKISEESLEAGAEVREQACQKILREPMQSYAWHQSRGRSGLTSCSATRSRCWPSKQPCKALPQGERQARPIAFKTRSTSPPGE